MTLAVILAVSALFSYHYFSHNLREQVDHQVREKLAIGEHLLAVAMQVVAVRSLPVEEVRVVIDAAAHVPERGIKTLPVGHCFWCIDQMPFSDMPRGVSGLFHHFRYRKATRWHAFFALGG